jgi:alginate O-acetyltransferase complex protein AlgI
MLFNSIEFLLFFTILFFLYWFVFDKNLKIQNLFLLFCSYFFYSRWDWRFLFLLLASTIIGYLLGMLIANAKREMKRPLLWVGISLNLLILVFFKYYNFFTGSAISLLHHVGVEVHPYFLSIALPVGLSFYTFHGMSYILDVYNEDTRPVKSFVDYAVFVGFFPLLVAGPIERATHLLPQVSLRRQFSYSQAVAGLRLILWGFFKKIVIADSAAPLVNAIFNSYHTMSVLSLFMGVVFFAFQIYGDFSGYSDIARGVSKLMGFELIINFNFPFYSKSISEFWRRWHISLNTWFVDYVYMPITWSARHWGQAAVYFAIFVSFFLSGLWHGAAWNYILFGLLHGFAIIFENITRNIKLTLAKKTPPALYHFFCRLFTIFYLLFTYVFFRSKSAGDAIKYIQELFRRPLYFRSDLALFSSYIYLPFMFLLLLTVEWINRDADNIAPFFGKIKNASLRYSFYLLILMFIFLLGTFENTTFIYFQF